MFETKKEEDTKSWKGVRSLELEPVTDWSNALSFRILREKGNP